MLALFVSVQSCVYPASGWVLLCPHPATLHLTPRSAAGRSSHCMFKLAWQTWEFLITAALQQLPDSQGGYMGRAVITGSAITW